MTTGNREDYLINILRITEREPTAKTNDLAALMGVSAASVSEMMSNLSKEGMISHQKYKGASLTEKGMEYARQLRRKHHMMEHFLINVLDADRATAHEEACRMEHVISDESAMKMCQIAGCNEKCNDGCDDCIGAATVSLASMGPASSGVISHLRCDGSAKLRKLISLGFVPGRTVRKDDDPAAGVSQIRIGDCEMAVDTELISSVFVDIG